MTETRIPLPDRFADAPRAKSHGGVTHTCNGPNLSGLPFGRKDPENCARCWELVNGAPAREDHAGVARGARARHDAARDTERKRHFAPGGPHATGACGPVCTAFDY